MSSVKAILKDNAGGLCGFSRRADFLRLLSFLGIYGPLDDFTGLNEMQGWVTRRYLDRQ